MRDYTDMPLLFYITATSSTDSVHRAAPHPAAPPSTRACAQPPTPQVPPPPQQPGRLPRRAQARAPHQGLFDRRLGAAAAAGRVDHAGVGMRRAPPAAAAAAAAAAAPAAAVSAARAALRCGGARLEGGTRFGRPRRTRRVCFCAVAGRGGAPGRRRLRRRRDVARVDVHRRTGGGASAACGVICAQARSVNPTTPLTGRLAVMLPSSC